jgi:hypothetical protein
MIDTVLKALGLFETPVYNELDLSSTFVGLLVLASRRI